jgi:hypothetical protein
MLILIKIPLFIVLFGIFRVCSRVFTLTPLRQSWRKAQAIKGKDTCNAGVRQ